MKPTLFASPRIVWRSHVAEELRRVLPGHNLYELAARHGVTVRKEGRLNKGWAGLTLERVARLASGNLQRSDGTDFELKSTSLLATPSGWRPKETLRVTQLNPTAILDEDFETSALWNKLASLILVGLHHESPTLCRVVQVSTFDLLSAELAGAIRSFWEEVQIRVSMGEIADYTSSRGTSSGYLQLRGTGDGKALSSCPVTGRVFPARAFYATKPFVKHVLEL